MTPDTSVVRLPPVGHRFASDGGGREIFGRRLELALDTKYDERGRWPWGMLAAARLLTELRLRVDEQSVFVPLLDRLRGGVPVGRLRVKASSVEDVADQLAKSIRVMLHDAEAGELLSEAADYAYDAVLRSRTWCETDRTAFQPILGRPGLGLAGRFRQRRQGLERPPPGHPQGRAVAAGTDSTRDTAGQAPQEMGEDQHGL
ncbi:hypothetical protein, partial [Streptomyces albidochromogenes]|uniref:hypothetical protein n=1 Tax=Streptomyces albidochromogenes TaxID=329524 RepID=UPI0031DBF94E